MHRSAIQSTQRYPLHNGGHEINSKTTLHIEVCTYIDALSMCASKGEVQSHWECWNVHLTTCILYKFRYNVVRTSL